MTDRTLIYYALLWVVIGIVSAGIYVYAPAPEIPYGTYYGSLTVTILDLPPDTTDARDIQNRLFSTVITNRGKFMASPDVCDELKIGETYVLSVWGSQIHGVVKEVDDGL